jgi:hypothetical protein
MTDPWQRQPVLDEAPHTIPESSTPKASILWELTFNQQLTEVLRAQRITRNCLKRCRCEAMYSLIYSHIPLK